MKNSFKVAIWEVKKMLKNKTFIVSVLLVPAIIVVFAILPNLLISWESKRDFQVYVIDEIGVYETLSQQQLDKNIILELYTGDLAKLQNKIRGNNNAGYLLLAHDVNETKQVDIITGGDGFPNLSSLQTAVESTLLHYRLLEYHLDPVKIKAVLTTSYHFNTSSLAELEQGKESFLQKYTPVLFSGGILFLSIITGMLAFQSAVNEKKDRMVEILLASVSAADLMQGKILSSFILGIFQGIIWLTLILISVKFIFGISILTLLYYLLVPELLLLLFFAITGYLMFSALFVALGATVNDLSSIGNFQSLLIIIPMLPIFLAGPILTNPSGLVAQIGSYFPLSTPGVMLLRISLTTNMTVLDIIIPAVILIVTTWLMFLAAGKIFKTGMMMYGKNASAGEIWKWLRC
ncbi:MAG: ABC transporter permease [Desulfotomaculum sp.]|nr:ABC transporter permease [Desulfotomaculum sp.]MCL0081426.1 ABC transporter permease [Peptococcaceae bacterium]